MVNSKTGWKPAAILAAGVVNFNAMMGDNEDQTLKNRKTHRALTGEFIATNYDKIFGSTGDSVIAEFVSPVDAVMTATEFQRN